MYREAHPAGKKEKAIKMYAVLDEQRNKSLAYICNKKIYK